MLRALIRSIVSLALPPRCAGCGAIANSDHRFCSTCWSGLRFLGPPWCASCHAPFAHDRGEGAWCAACLADPPRHGGIGAAVAYGPVARTVALRLKYGQRAAFAETMARLMTRHLPPGADLLIPVPLHRWRLWSRGYNQAALIAAALSDAATVPCASDLLVRKRQTAVLRGLSGAARRRAVRGAFAVPADKRTRIRDRHVVLIDDVYTSGATADACVHVLLAAGATRVSVLCWARVIEDTAD